MTKKTVPMKYRRMEFNAQLQTENDRLCAQRDALLEALRAMRVKYGQYACRVCDLADAAIKAVEGEKK